MNKVEQAENFLRKELSGILPDNKIRQMASDFMVQKTDLYLKIFDAGIKCNQEHPDDDSYDTVHFEMVLKETLDIEKLDLEHLALETKINGETFVPILELCYIALKDIYGENAEEHCTQMVEVYDEDDRHEAFGVVTHYFDTRIGFTFNYEKGRKEFEISADGNRLMIDQLQLFDKLREWNFNI